MKRFGKQRYWFGLAICAAFGVGFVVAGITAKPTQADKVDPGKYPLLAKRIFMDDPNDALVNFAPLRASLKTKFDLISQPYSVYFEYLPTGTSIRINGEDQLTAASLVKLPLTMDLYKASEKGLVKLDDKVKLTKDDLDPAYGELYQKGEGTELTLREAAKLALSESDNTAAKLIKRSVDGKLRDTERSLPWLDIDYDMKDGEAVIGARAYASILKCLYLSCYLKEDSSEELLGYLDDSKYDTRLTKYTPADLRVAHKFGVYNPTNINSDCGIFYVPKRPYLLCIMMEGRDEEVSPIMADVSKQVYDWVTGR